MTTNKTDLKVVEYQKNYTLLTKNLLSELPNIYEYLILVLKTKELETGFKVTRVNKATKKGTEITCKEFKSEEEVSKYSDVLLEDFKKCGERITQEDIDRLTKYIADLKGDK